MDHISLEFGKHLRLLEQAQFTDIFRSRGWQRTAGAVRIKTKKNGLGHPRLGLVVPKRAIAKANRRNRIKRIIRERFRLNQNALPGEDILIQIFGPLEDQTLSENLDTLLGMLATEKRS